MIIFTIIGLLSCALLILGYRPIIDIDAKPDWEVVTSISTILAVLVALFITKWQDIINNKKKLSISWLYIEKIGEKRLGFPNITDRILKDEICIRITNIGNRSVFLDTVFIEIKCSKTPAFFLSPDVLVTGSVQITKFPFLLEPEMVSQFYISFSWFTDAVCSLIKEEKIKENDEIKIAVKDSTGNIYQYNTHQKYSLFVNDKNIKNCKSVIIDYLDKN